MVSIKSRFRKGEDLESAQPQSILRVILILYSSFLDVELRF
jgi:hypothetical protein